MQLLAGDDRVREEHAILDGTTLPPSDPFWNNYLPPLGWNCRCTTVQVRKDKYPRSDSAEAIAKGQSCTAKPKQQIFRFNPGKQEKIFPPKHPYFPKGCGICQHKLSYDPNNPNCNACKSIAKCLNTFGNSEKISARRKQIKEEAKRFIGIEFKHPKFEHNVIMSNRTIKELLNQPHKHYLKKNEAVSNIDKLFSHSIFRGELSKENPNDNFTSFLFETKISNEKSWIIVKKYDTESSYFLYSISDSEKLTKYIKK